MRYRSVRGESPSLSFREAVLRGIAPDGSLYIPEKIPQLPRSFLDHLADASLHTVGRDVASLFIDEISAEELAGIVRGAWNFPIPLVQLEERIFLLELFHGPTLAFKDVGARFMAHILSHFLAQEHRELSIVVATSGDTGSAVAHGFYNIPRISVYVLYPSGKITKLQEQQMTTLGGNIHAVEVDGTFDDCQRMVKQALADRDIHAARSLTTANSINLGRLIPQIAYYVWAIAQFLALRRSPARPDEDCTTSDRSGESAPEQDVFGSRPARPDKSGSGGAPSEPQGPSGMEDPIVVVPSGNFGNLTAAVYAKWMGMPISGFIAATNANDVVPQYLQSGIFHSRPSIHTLSNAMDVGNPSNLARLQALYDNNVDRLRADVTACSVSDRETLDEIRRTYERTSYVLDPHTAVGVRAARTWLDQHSTSAPIIVTATAHPGKFPETVERALGKTMPLPAALERALSLSKQSIRIPNDYEQWKRLLLN